MWIIHVISVVCFLCFCARLFVVALCSPARKGLTYWLSFVMSNYDFVTFPLVFWVRCGTRLYRFPIFTLFLTFIMCLSDDKQALIIDRLTKHLDIWMIF